MDYKDAIVCLKSRQYGPVANYMLKEAFGNNIHDLKKGARNKITRLIAKKLKANYERVYSLQKGDYTPNNIAEKVYEETYDELVEELRKLGFDVGPETLEL